MKKLFKDYKECVRPVETLNGTIRVKFGLAISQLVDVVNSDLISTENILYCLLCTWSELHFRMFYLVKFLERMRRTN